MAGQGGPLKQVATRLREGLGGLGREPRGAASRPTVRFRYMRLDQVADANAEVLDPETTEKKLSAMTAQQNVQNTANLANYIFRSPRPIAVAVAILLLSPVLGLTLWPSVPDGLTAGLLVFAGPALLAAAASTALAVVHQGRLPLRRTMLLSAGGVLGVWAIGLLRWVQPGALPQVLIMGLGLLAFPRHATVVFVAQHRHVKALVVSLLHPVLGLGGLAVVHPFSIWDLILAAGSLASGLLGSLLFLEIMAAPMKLNFRSNLYRNTAHTLDHFIEGNVASARHLEEFFASFGEEQAIHTGVLSLRSTGNDRPGDAGRRSVKVLMVVPSVHPGPFGDIGAGGLPQKIAETLRNVTHAVVVPHGPATHDQNVVFSRDCARIGRQVRAILDQIPYSTRVSPFVRVRGEFDLGAQVFGNGVLLVHTSAPMPTDDVDYATGFGAVLNARLAGAERGFFIDAHNCLEPGSGGVYFGSPRSLKMIEAAGEATAKALEAATDGPIEAGYAEDRRFELHDGLGPNGIQVVVVRVPGQTMAYVVYDGNNMVPGLRDRLRTAVLGLVDEAEVFTTDNHAVNVGFGGYNPVGMSLAADVLERRTVAAVKAALRDLSPCEAGLDAGFVRNVRVFGAENTTRLTTTVNSSVAVGVKAGAVCALTSVLLCALIYLALSSMGGW